MKLQHYWNSVLALSLAGTLFAGYLSGVKLITGTCALSEPCPLFLGYPACWFGFVMFLIMCVVSVRARFFTMRPLCHHMMRVVSSIGILFAGYLVAQEMPLLFGSFPPVYALGLPSCAYGLIFYVAIFVISFLPISSWEEEPSAVIR